MVRRIPGETTIAMTGNFHLPSEFKIVSGGQAGADRAGLDWAIAHGIPHGGWCPKGRKAEDGPTDPRYELVETPDEAYSQRTEWNVRDSDATLIFSFDETLDGGSKNTAVFADLHGKPWLHVHPGISPESIAEFLRRHQPHIVNVAGKRESLAPGIANWVIQILDRAITKGK
jgi:hypothetical protein